MMTSRENDPYNGKCKRELVDSEVESKSPRAVHLAVTRTQTADEFQKKRLNALNKASCNHLRQCRSLQDHSRLDQSYQEEREDAELQRYEERITVFTCKRGGHTKCG